MELLDSGGLNWAGFLEDMVGGFRKDCASLHTSTVSPGTCMYCSFPLYCLFRKGSKRKKKEKRKQKRKCPDSKTRIEFTPLLTLLAEDLE